MDCDPGDSNSMIQFSDKNADACSTLQEPYNITSSNNQFSISVDGGSNQVFTLTNGSARTAAQIVADLAGLTGAVASVVTINNINYVRIRDNSANGTSSTLLFNSPSNNSNAILGFTATTYTGGTNVCYSFPASSVQNVINGIETALNNAGWITISGHQSTPCVVQSSMTPPGQNLRMRITMTAGSNVQINASNVSGTLAGTGSATQSYIPAVTGMAYSVLANKYQAFVYVNGNYAGQYNGSSYGYATCWGVPWIPSFLYGILWEAIWFTTTTDCSVPPAFPRIGLTNITQSGTYNCWWETFTNGMLSNNGNQQQFQSGGLGLLLLLSGVTSNNFGVTCFRYHDLTSLMCDPLISWGTMAYNDEGTIKGQLWDAFISTDSFQGDTVITSVDGANWHAMTHNNQGAFSNSNWGYRGTLFILTPETSTP